jgi:DNA-binding NarL/FixJ family response regulator
MKTEENMSQTDCSFHRGHTHLAASAVPQTRTFSMPIASQSVGISVSTIEGNSSTNPSFCDWIRLSRGFSLVSRHKSIDRALLALPNERPSIVLIDVDRPGRTVFDCLRQLKPTLPQTQFVVFVADEDDDSIFNALIAGATGYLSRQASRNELFAELKLIYAGGSPMGSDVAKKVLLTFQYQSRHNSTAELSPRETRILRLLANGSSHREAAAALNINLPMVSTYIRSIYEKLHPLRAAAKVLQ